MSTIPPPENANELATSARFISMTSTIAKHLLEVHGVDEPERAIQLYAVVENGVFDYMSQGTSKLSDATNQAYTAWIASAKKKLVRS